VHTDEPCALAARREGIDPVGSAPSTDELWLVDLPLPWSRDVKAALQVVHDLVPRGARVQATVPADQDRRRVVRWWAQRRADGLTAGYGRAEAVADPDALVEHVAALAAVTQPLDDGVVDVVICAHGARDTCCGSDGTALARALADAGAAVRVSRSSHLGGHRFAPTALVLPQGTAWAGLTLDLLLAIVERSVPPSAVRRHYRGSLLMPDGPAQALDRELLCEHGWAWLDRARAGTSDGSRVEVAYEDAGRETRRVVGEVEVARTVSLAPCRGLLTSSPVEHPDLVVRSFAEVG